MHGMATGLVCRCRRALMWCLIAMLGACAADPGLVDHAFGFDAVNESKAVEVLAYAYSRNGKAIVSSDTAIRQFGSAHQGTSIHGPMPLGDSLYLK